MKSGITVEECAQGFRIVQLLRKFDVYDEFDVSGNEEDEYEELDLDVDMSSSLANHNPSTKHTNGATNPYFIGNKKSPKIKNNKIIYFLEHIYKNCKSLV